MTFPPEQRIQFFVFVIESPSAVDLYHRRGEGEIIRQAVRLNQIPCEVRTVISPQALEASLKIGLAEAMAQYPGRIPIIHFSVHGFPEGIQLSDLSIIEWRFLKDLLRPINQALNGSLVVCMSSCKGYAGARMAMHPEDQDLPFLALVGCAGDPTWADTAVAYSTFYHQLCRGEHVSVAVEAMKIASGNQFFFLNYAEQSRKAFLDYLSSANPDRAQEKLEEQLTEESPDHLQSLRKLT